MPTIEQIKAARALLGWSQGDLAKASDLSQTGIGRIENGENKPNAETTNKILSAFKSFGVEFIEDEGVRHRKTNIKTYRGADELRVFMDDVYMTARDLGGDLCIFNTRPENWLRLLGLEWCRMHAKRMVDVKKNMRFRAITKRNDDVLIGQSFIEYRWIPEEKFNDRSFYCYGDKIAFLDFSDNDVYVWVLQHKQFCEGFRVLFDISWEFMAQKPEKIADDILGVV